MVDSGDEGFRRTVTRPSSHITQKSPQKFGVAPLREAVGSSLYKVWILKHVNFQKENHPLIWLVQVTVVQYLASYLVITSNLGFRKYPAVAKCLRKFVIIHVCNLSKKYHGKGLGLEFMTSFCNSRTSRSIQVSSLKQVLCYRRRRLRLLGMIIYSYKRNHSFIHNL